LQTKWEEETFALLVYFRFTLGKKRPVVLELDLRETKSCLPDLICQMKYEDSQFFNQTRNDRGNNKPTHLTVSGRYIVRSDYDPSEMILEARGMGEELIEALEEK
jgi:hypothetical protein